ncbi:MAG: sialate O-acetylesterase [Clostridia bacterium]
MKFFKKFPAVLLAAAIFVSVLPGCTGGSKNPHKKEDFITNYAKRTAPAIEKSEEVAPTAEKFTVSRVFSNNMVLQRDEYIRIWGWAKNQDGKTVCAEFMGLKGSAVIENGAWMITLDGTLGASAEKGNTLRVYSETYEKKFKNVLVGDVYMVIGQSNAAYVVNNFLADAAQDETYRKMFTKDDITNDDNIRVIRNVMGDPSFGGDKTSSLADNVNHTRGWQLPSQIGINTSALGYFFAKQVIRKTNNEIPIGIIECSAAGCVMAAFMSPEAAEACKVDSYDESKKGYYAESEIGPQQSRVMFNQYINPFMNYTISGILWYQGESDAPEGIRADYPENFKTLITDYRDKINQNYHDFPVFIVELPTEYTQPADFSGAMWAYIDFGGVRSYMGNIPSILDNAFIAVSSDIWKNKEYWNNLHPYCKWPMAERITNMAMPLFYDDYTEDSIEFTAGPVFVKADAKSERAADLYFTHVGDGLKIEGGSEAKGFEVLSGGTWTPPEKVSVSEYTISVSHSSAFTAVRYNGITTAAFPEDLNVCNSAGVPLAAFCWTAGK